MPIGVQPARRCTPSLPPALRSAEQVGEAMAVVSCLRGARQYRGSSSGLDVAMLAKLRLLLTVLDRAPGPEGLRGNPRWLLHPLQGDMAGFWSVRVTGNWRLVFRFENHEAVVTPSTI